ncbi:hypothetical protein A2U01_0007223, partial [Trifolium medium]|nr:hypothetical protein [Trifolium medium]
IYSAFQNEGLQHLEQFEGLVGGSRAFSKRVTTAGGDRHSRGDFSVAAGLER